MIYQIPHVNGHTNMNINLPFKYIGGNQQVMNKQYYGVWNFSNHLSLIATGSNGRKNKIDPIPNSCQASCFCQM